MAHSPVFSVVTVTFEAADGLPTTASSVLQQQESSLEYIIFDNCSTDNTSEIAKHLAHDDHRVRFCSERDLGIFDAMNKAIRIARGRYLIFMGAGDTLLPNVLSAIERHLPGHDRGFIYGDFLCEGIRYGERFTKRRLCEHNICHQAIFYGREIFLLCGQYDLTYPFYADWAFNLKCFSRPEVEKVRVPFVISEIALPGRSSRGDPAFHRDLWKLITTDYGRLECWQMRFLQPEFPFLNRAELEPKVRQGLGSH